MNRSVGIGSNLADKASLTRRASASMLAPRSPRTISSTSALRFIGKDTPLAALRFGFLPVVGGTRARSTPNFSAIRTEARRDGAPPEPTFVIRANAQRGDPMSAPTIKFDDGAVYERMMGKWSGLAGRAFIDWLSPPPNLRWVDIGCGNGAFTQLLVEHCAPMTVEGVDPSEGQLAFARERLATPVAKFRQGDAMALPFADGTFDAAVMALVVFFIPDPARGVAEMARVVRPGGLAAAYVWDVVSGGGPSEAIIIEMKGMGFAPPRAPKAEASTPEGLHALWTRAGFADIEARVLRTRRTFDDFEDYWSTTIAAPNLAPMLTTMATADVTQLKSRVREQVPIEASGRVSIEAHANAIVGRRPG